MNKYQVAVIISITVYACWNIGIWLTYDEDFHEDRSGPATVVGFVIISFLFIMLTASGFFG